MEKKAKKKKKIWKILIIVLICIVAALFVTVLFLDSIIAGTMRSVGTQATGTKLTVKSVSLSLMRGDLRINEMAIDNPADYKVKHAFSFDLVHVDLDMSTLLSDTIIVEKVEIANIKIDYEPTLKGGSNLNDIKENIMKFIGADKAVEEEKEDKSGEKPEEKSGENAPKTKKKIIIKSFVINKGTIMVSSNMIKTTIPVPLARIELNDIGKDGEMGEAFADIYNKILKAVLETVASANFKDIKLDAVTKDLPNAAGKMGKDIGKVGKDIGKGIKDLF